MKENLVLDALERQRQLKNYEVLTLFDIAVLSTTDSATEMSLKTKYSNYKNLLFPWNPAPKGLQTSSGWTIEEAEAELKKMGIKVTKSNG